GQDNTFDDDVDEPSVQDLALNVDQVFQADQCDAFDYDYVKNNAEKVIQSNVSFVPNDALMMIINDMHEHAAQCIYVKDQNKVVNESLTAELARYKEQVDIYEKRARLSKIHHSFGTNKWYQSHSEALIRRNNLYIEDLIMAYTSSSSSSSSNLDTKVSTFSKVCLKSYETLKEHYDNLTKDFNLSQFNLGNHMPSKPNLVFADEHVFSESVTSLPTIAKSEIKTSESKLKTVSDPIIKEWVSDDEEEDVS
nr:hypothetical protein [Tanacetum cinerariifolium]